LVLDSQSFDEYVEGAYLVKKFSEDEKEYFRDIRKRIKNRESARKSRKNKRTKMDTLESQVLELTEESNNLRQENHNLSQENFQLKNEVVYLQSVISNYNSYESKKSIKPENSSSPMSTHSVILFVFLFSFGILWNLDSSIFNSSFNHLQNNKHQFISQSVKNSLVEDKMLNQLLDKIQSDASRTEDMKYDGDPAFEKSPPKKDVEICCF